MNPNFDLNKIKFATDKSTFEKAVSLYEGKKIRNFKEELDWFSALVLGGNPYNVSISAKKFGSGSCDCYMGKNDYFCKHMVAVAIYAVLCGKSIKKEDKEVNHEPKCSGYTGNLPESELDSVKKSISDAMKYFKPYNGPSRLWFSYQSSLFEGCNRLSDIISNLPVSKQTADLLVKILIRLDRKLNYGGVDDSDGTVGEFIESAVEVLKEFSEKDSACKISFEILRNKETCFDWQSVLFENNQK